MRRPAAEVRYAPSDGVAYREIEGQILLLRSDEDVLQTFNPAGAFIWKRLVRRQAPSRIARALAGHFAIAPARAQADVAGFIAALEAQGIIRRVPR